MRKFRAEHTWFHAFLWTRTGGMQDLGTPSENQSCAWDINDSGQVVGGISIISASHAFLWTNSGGMRDLGTLGGRSCGAYGINDRGEVVGYVDYNTGHDEPEQAFLWTDGGGVTYLGALSAGCSSEARDINNNGQIVGLGFIGGGNAHAFLWTRSDGMQDLNRMFDPSAGCTLIVATGINDSGQIVAWGTNASGRRHAFLLTPIPEPSTLTILGGGALSLLVCAWHRRQVRQRRGNGC